MFSGFSNLVAVTKIMIILEPCLLSRLKQINLDTEEAHRRAGPVDNPGL